MSIIKTKINDKNYNDIVMKDENPFVLVFVSKTCPHCRTVELFMEKVEEEYSGVDIFFIEGEKSPKLIEKFGVMSFPTTKFVNKEKKGVGRIVGATVPEDFFRLFDKINVSKDKNNFLKKIFGGRK